LQAPTRAAWDCRAGCAHCCFLWVEVTPREAARLAPLVTPGIARRIRENAEAARGNGPAAYRRPCAFLSTEGSCLAYEARPLRCRAHVSADESVCAAARERAVPTGAVPGDPWLATVVAAVQRGLGGPLVELHTALAARSNAKARRREG